MTKYYADKPRVYPCKYCGEMVVVPRTVTAADGKRNHEKICKGKK